MLRERSVFVGGIEDSDEDDLQDYFDTYGRVVFVTIAYSASGK